MKTMIMNINIKNNEVYSDQKVNLIIKKVYEEQSKNDPEKALTNFQYKNYEYLQISANPDSISGKIDTIQKRNIFGKFCINELRSCITKHVCCCIIHLKYIIIFRYINISKWCIVIQVKITNLNFV